MRKHLTVISIAVGILFSHSIAARSQQGHVIRGKVRSAAGINLPRATVDLQIGSGALIEQTVTNNEGDFTFAGLGETSYVVVVSAPDFTTVAERVDFVRRVGANQPGETRTVEITLLPKLTARIPRASSTFVQNVPQPARTSLTRGLKLAKQSKSDLAQTMMREAIKLFPEYFDAHFALGSELMKSGQLRDAIEELERARKINPNDERVYQVFGLVLIQQKKYALAAAVFAEASRLNPNDPQTRLLRAIALIEHAGTIHDTQATARGERDFAFSEADKSLAQAYELSGGKLAIVHLQRARILEKKGDLSRAADELEQYLRDAPEATNADAIRAAIKKLRGLDGRS
ncbi:MAG: hypothetical protein QOJ64_3015 [Acidobacteriota bacterium]|jgi:Tfp pilus assembly protein PilF|nr:hypothetical protein [Acidobacteriota bacterium]